MADVESISLEETNKIRISLGLKPLTDDKAPTDDKEKEAEDNYSNTRKREAKERSDKALRNKIDKLRNKHELNAKLKGRTLGDADGDEGDTLGWIKKSKKREKELSKRRQQELEEMDKMFQEKYDENDLAGLKVTHDLGGMGEGEEQILTLKDSRILEDKEDELQNVLMAEHKRTEDRIHVLKKKRDYTGYDDDEFKDGQAGMKLSVLSKYDEDLHGPQESGFRLGQSAARQTTIRHKPENEATVKKSLLTIDYAKNQEISDYLQEGDVGFKKPKKKKKAASRRVVEAETGVNEGNEPESMEIDQPPALRNLNTNFVDDDELQAALARSRRANIKAAPKLSPEEVARRIAEEKAEAAKTVPMDINNEGGEGLTIDDTTEFVQGIVLGPKVEKRVLVIPRSAVATQDTHENTGDQDIKMEELEAGEIDGSEDEEMQAAMHALEREFGAEETSKPSETGNVGTASEGTHGAGLGGTLNILRAQGALPQISHELREREGVQKERDLWLAEQRTRVAQRELDRIKARSANKDQQQREYENRLREQQEARGALEIFRDYKPDVNIVYHDEFGREMTPKEAWKALSHRFHGKGSGRMKTEKRLKRIAEEKKLEGMSSSDTPLSMTKAFQMRQEKMGQAHMVLSVGNRGAAPQLGQYLDNPTLMKPKAEKKGKKNKEPEKNSDLIDVTHFVTGQTPATNPDTTTNTVLQAPRAGFTKVGSFTAYPASSGSGNASPNGTTRVALNLKRKAEDEGLGTPPSKKR